MTDKPTWSEFVELYKPKDGDKFLDDRGQEWTYKKHEFHCGPSCIFALSHTASILTCPLIPPKAKRKLRPALIEDQNGYFVSERLFENEKDALHFYNEQLRRWPAVPNADGSYEIE